MKTLASEIQNKVWLPVQFKFTRDRNTYQKTEICLHCGFEYMLANPSGKCNHVYYPDNCKVCKRKAADNRTVEVCVKVD